MSVSCRAPTPHGHLVSQDVAGLGTAGATVKVKAGFARNFLLPQRMGDQVPSVLSLSRRERLRAKAAQAAEAPVQQVSCVGEEMKGVGDVEAETALKTDTGPMPLLHDGPNGD